MERESKPEKEMQMIQKPNPTPEYKNETPISTKEEAIATLKKSIEGNSWNQIEVLSSGEMVIAVYVIQGYPDELKKIYHFRLERAVFDKLNAEGLLRELQDHPFGHGWDLKPPAGWSPNGAHLRGEDPS